MGRLGNSEGILINDGKVRIELLRPKKRFWFQQFWSKIILSCGCLASEVFDKMVMIYKVHAFYGVW